VIDLFVLCKSNNERRLLARKETFSGSAIDCASRAGGKAKLSDESGGDEGFAIIKRFWLSSGMRRRGQSEQRVGGFGAHQRFR
jgi:hypothetical protein